MLFSELRRIISWLTRSSTQTQAGRSEASAETEDSALQFEPVWHGDHWQNLLASPMDARRYVMEDWSVPASSDWRTAEGLAPAR
ncbi:hypothetical protein LFL96_15080 [Paraburkholderia sp. D15]|nr:hypothetical protein [Paraburkholderia sp. D15]WGS49083.1 hypothetical protein LFL96_15080 [Paraburkholderia sp. D15]